MNQTPLFNYNTLSATRAVNAARRARASASTSSKSETIAIEKSPAGPVAAPANGLTRSPASSPAKRSDRRPDLHDGHSEFNLPDEDRTFEILIHPRCLGCGKFGCLHRRKFGSRLMFMVRCPKTDVRPEVISRRIPCVEPTPWLKSSAAAIGHWKLIQKLTRP